jgi:O-antigen/teichoic acid export membrane protein
MRRRVRAIFKDDLIRHTIIVFFGTSITGVFNLIYHLVCVRLLTPQDYGTFNALISLVTFGLMAFSPIGTAFTRFFTEYITRKQFPILIAVIRKLFLRFILTGSVIFILFLIFAGQLACFLKAPNLYIVITGGIITLSVITIFIPPVFQSFQKFKSLSFLGISSSLGKLLFGAGLMALGLGVIGALSGFLVSSLLLIFVALCFIPNIKKEVGSFSLKDSKEKEIDLRPIFKYFLPVSLTMLSFTVFTNIDIILVKRFFSPLDAGYYSIAQMVGKIALFFPSALAIVIFPKTTKAHVENTLSRSFLYKSLFIAAITGAIFTIISFFFPGIILRILTGQESPVSTQLVGLFVLAMSIYALTWIVVHFLLASHNTKIVVPFVAIAFLQAILIYFYHQSLHLVLGIVFAFSLVSFITSLSVVKYRTV